MKEIRSILSSLFLWLLFLTGMQIRLQAQSNAAYQISGKIFLDTLANCVYDSGEPATPGIQLVTETLPSGASAYSVSDQGVSYIPMFIFGPSSDTVLRVYARGLNNLGYGCPVVYEFPLTGVNANFTVDFPVQSGNCPQMGVDISGLSPRPTSSNLEYIIAEDLIMYRQDVYQLGAYKTLNIKMPASGSTWHLSAEQQPDYPGGSFTNATLEGFGSNQSGGLTTAYQVEVRDVLPAGLDLHTVIPGAASHPYFFALTQVMTNTVFNTIGTNFIEIVPVYNPTVPDIELQFFPNPATQFIHFECSRGSETIVEIELVNLLGNSVRSCSSAVSFFDMSCAGLPAGQYMLFARTHNQRVMVAKVFIQ